MIDPVDVQLKPVGVLEVNTEGNNQQGLVGMRLDPQKQCTGSQFRESVAVL